MPSDPPVREPQLARVVLDDFEQREAERGAGVGVGGRPHRARGTRAGSALRPEPRSLDPLPGEDQRGRRTVDDRLAERDVHVVRAHAHLHDPAPLDDRRPCRLEVQRRTERHRREEADPPLAQPGGVAVAQLVDHERRSPRRCPRAVHDRPLEPASRAASTDRCSGLRSPPTRANASIAAGATSSPTASVRAGRACRSGAGVARRARTARRAAAPHGGGRGRGDRRPRDVAIVSPPRVTVPVAVQRASPSRGTSRVVSARTCRTSPADNSASSCSHGCSDRKSASPASRRVSSTSWTSWRRSSRSVAGASPRIASSASTVATSPRALSTRARQRKRVGAPTGSCSSTSQADAAPRSPGSGGQAGPGVTACVACTSSWKRAASSGVASSEQTAGHARVQARSSGTPSCAAPVAAR